jgi:hypothetical protein
MARAAGKPGERTRGMQMSRAVTALSLLILMSILTFLYSHDIKRIMSLGLPGVLAIGAAYLLAMKHLEKKGSTAVKRSQDAERGTEAEKKVGDFLDSLPEGNFVIHEFDSGQGNIGHILIGPKGIFTIDTKSHRGVVEFSGTILLRDGRPFDKDFLKQAKAQCLLAEKILENWQIRNPRPEALLVFTDAFVKVRGKAKGVSVVSAGDFPRFLERLPDRMTISEAGRVYNRLRSAVKLPGLV